MVDQIHKTVNSDAASISEVPPFDVASARKLHAALLGPVAPGLRGARNLIVVPHGTLGRLPFALLVTKDTAQPQERRAVVLPGQLDLGQCPRQLRDAAKPLEPGVPVLHATSLRRPVP